MATQHDQDKGNRPQSCTHELYDVRLYEARSDASHSYWSEVIALPSGQDRLVGDMELHVGL